jgi:hypothetical protein
MNRTFIGFNAVIGKFRCREVLVVIVIMQAGSPLSDRGIIDSGKV